MRKSHSRFYNIDFTSLVYEIPKMTLRFALIGHKVYVSRVFLHVNMIINVRRDFCSDFESLKGHWALTHLVVFCEGYLNNIPLISALPIASGNTLIPPHKQH